MDPRLIQQVLHGPGVALADRDTVHDRTVRIIDIGFIQPGIVRDRLDQPVVQEPFPFRFGHAAVDPLQHPGGGGFEGGLGLGEGAPCQAVAQGDGQHGVSGVGIGEFAGGLVQPEVLRIVEPVIGQHRRQLVRRERILGIL